MDSTADTQWDERPAGVLSEHDLDRYRGAIHPGQDILVSRLRDEIVARQGPLRTGHALSSAELQQALNRANLTLAPTGGHHGRTH